MNMLIKYIKNPWKIFSFFNNHNLMTWVPDKLHLKLLYRATMKKKLNISDPELFTEKMQWLKLNDRKDIYTTMVDKYMAKKYVADIIGEEYIIPTIGVWDSFDEIDFDALPNQFVLKCTHDSGGLVICTDKSKLNKEKAKIKINKSLKRDYYKHAREWPYKNVKRRIIAEEYLENNEEGLHDYKIWCFNGKPVYIQYITGRTGNGTYEGFYDVDWNLQSFSYHNPIMKAPVPRPVCLEKLIEFAEKLATDRPFLRCDFYVLEDGSIKFGELTFYPMSGMGIWHPEEMNETFGEMIDLNFKK